MDRLEWLVRRVHASLVETLLVQARRGLALGGDVTALPDLVALRLDLTAAGQTGLPRGRRLDIVATARPRPVTIATLDGRVIARLHCSEPRP
jgi:hypothetical protein